MIKKSERYREILAVLARHGIGVVGDEFIKHKGGDRARAEHLRRACEELGTLFIKLGQALSTRGDLLPDTYCDEIAKLQDEVVPVPARVIEDVIRKDLGAPLDKLFASFDLKPLGSASIGQVHAARLFDHREVVIKVASPMLTNWLKSILRFWAASSMNGPRVSQCSSDTTPAACLENSATCCLKTRGSARRPANCSVGSPP